MAKSFDLVAIPLARFDNNCNNLLYTNLPGLFTSVREALKVLFLFSISNDVRMDIFVRRYIEYDILCGASLSDEHVEFKLGLINL